jgi:hypothetical protein
VKNCVPCSKLAFVLSLPAGVWSEQFKEFLFGQTGALDLGAQQKRRDFTV